MYKHAKTPTYKNINIPTPHRPEPSFSIFSTQVIYEKIHCLWLSEELTNVAPGKLFYFIYTNTER